MDKCDDDDDNEDDVDSEKKQIIRNEGRSILSSLKVLQENRAVELLRDNYRIATCYWTAQEEHKLNVIRQRQPGFTHDKRQPLPLTQMSLTMTCASSIPQLKHILLEAVDPRPAFVSSVVASSSSIEGGVSRRSTSGGHIPVGSKATRDKEGVISERSSEMDIETVTEGVHQEEHRLQQTSSDESLDKKVMIFFCFIYKICIFFLFFFFLIYV